MTATDRVAFETLIYTDCVPGQGLQGSAGLQFQARSPGADRAAMSLVQNSELYEPPPNWMRERRPAHEYPPSFAHAFDGVYATATGVYLGREANGAREGNQLTHAIVTSDPGGYLLHRPAQLFGAPFWSDRPAQSTECAPVRHPWEPGPFDIEAAQTFVVNAPRGADLLEALLSALQALRGDNPRRILFIGEDAAEVLRWISAATLLMPQREALGIGFKVFTTNPAYAPQPVVAVHPDWDSTSVTVDDDGGYAVFDLRTNRWTPVPASTDAKHRVQLFLDEDPYDVLDVVELAAASGRTDPGEALGLAQSMALPARPLSLADARVAVSWLKETPATLLEPSRGVLLDKLLGDIRQWPEEILLDLDEVAAGGKLDPERVPEVRIALVTAELNRAATTGTASGVSLPALPDDVWQARHVRECEDRVTDELSRYRNGRAFDAVLRVAHRFDLRVHLDQIPEALEAFVEHWSAHPEAAYSPHGWGKASSRVVERLRAELTAQVENTGAAAVGDAWHRWFAVKAPLSESILNAALLSAAMLHADPPRRAALAKEMLTAAVTAPQGEDPVGRTAAALWRRTPPSRAEYDLIAEIVPAETRLADNLFTPLTEPLLRPDGSRPRLEEMRLLRRLYDRGLVRPTRELNRLMRDSDELAAMCRGLRVAGPKELAEYPKVLKTAAAPARELWADEIARALLDVRHPAASDLILQQLPHRAQRRYLEQLQEALRKPTEPVLVVVALQLGGADFLGPDHRRACMDRVWHWIGKASEKLRRKATEFVEQAATRERRQEWAALLESKEQRRTWPWRRGKAEA